MRVGLLLWPSVIIRPPTSRLDLSDKMPILVTVAF
jgi:hypothetical protein